MAFMTGSGYSIGNYEHEFGGRKVDDARAANEYLAGSYSNPNANGLDIDGAKRSYELADGSVVNWGDVRFRGVLFDQGYNNEQVNAIEDRFRSEDRESMLAKRAAEKEFSDKFHEAAMSGRASIDSWRNQQINDWDRFYENRNLPQAARDNFMKQLNDQYANRLKDHDAAMREMGKGHWGA